MIGSLNVLDIVCYIQEAYRSAQHFVLGIRSWKYVVTDELFIHSLRRKVHEILLPNPQVFSFNQQTETL